ncbi:HAD domain-containing protein [Nocardia xishanensis]|uniref:HAD domain-containing protein n=1 Tax=Nocardia xishanensis TaxID=238964 RepID=UPI00082D4C67|nr:HAD domain-containing protein [Nocardia xishanensis]
MDRPLLYLDVDGPLNPFAAKPHRRPEGYETHRLLPASWVARCTEMKPHRKVKELRVWLNPAHGPKLLALADRFELVWATTWEHDANEWIGPRIGLPELPVVEWQTSKRFGPDLTFFKTAELVEHAAGRPFVWVDDEMTVRDRRYVEREHPGRALLHWVDPAKGLLDADFEALAAWAVRPADTEGSAA